jgi:NAD(P)H-hydrate epimerase
MKYITRKSLVLPKHKKSSHKGDYGKVLVIAGSEEYAGAPALVGLAALRSGCDWVTIAAPEKVAWAINSLSPDLVTHKLKGSSISAKHINDLISLSSRFNVIAIGNGMGLTSDTKTVVNSVLKKVKKPKVIDADAIKVAKLQDISNSVITPHKKELESLLINSLPKNELSHFYKNKIFILDEKNIKILQKHLKDNVLLVKGMYDFIITKENIYCNKAGNAGMIKAGTGDVLAGICAGFIAQGLSLERAAVNASFINKAIGDDLWKERHQAYSYIASDIVDDIERYV